MAETTARDRLQPSLLDRLTDRQPDKTSESRDERLLTSQALRQAVLRDIAWLFNAVRPEAPYWLLNDRGEHANTYREELQFERFQDWQALPEVKNSVLCFGLPCLSGVTASTLDIPQLEATIRRAILDFEPRIIASSLRVEAEINEAVLAHHNLIAMRISANLWAQPVPLELLLRTELDLESGQVHVQEVAR
ncbi:type VI secretion system baseplate subunit TssE [soil metagenome]